MDITAHEMDSMRGDLHEIFKATGGPHGSVGLSFSPCGVTFRCYVHFVNFPLFFFSSFLILLHCSSRNMKTV